MRSRSAAGQSSSWMGARAGLLGERLEAEMRRGGAGSKSSRWVTQEDAIAKACVLRSSE